MMPLKAYQMLSKVYFIGMFVGFTLGALFGSLLTLAFVANALVGK